MSEKNGFMIEDGELSECLLNSTVKSVTVLNPSAQISYTAEQIRAYEDSKNGL